MVLRVYGLKYFNSDLGRSSYIRGVLHRVQVDAVSCKDVFRERCQEILLMNCKTMHKRRENMIDELSETVYSIFIHCFIKF